MRKLHFVLILGTFALINCSVSPEEKAQKSIKDYLQKNLNDAKSYESVEFGALDTFKTDFYTSFEYELLKIDLDAKLKLSDDALKDMEIYDPKICLQQSKDALKEAEEIQKEINQKELEFKPESCYKMWHKYRAKNKLGAVVLENTTFILSKDFQIKETK